MTFSMIFGGKMAKSSNHHALLEDDGLIESGVALDEEENLKVVSGEDEDEEDEVMKFISEF